MKANTSMQGEPGPGDLDREKATPGVAPNQAGHRTESSGVNRDDSKKVRDNLNPTTRRFVDNLPIRGSTPGSKLRRMFSYVALFMIIALIVDAFIWPLGLTGFYLFYFMPLFSILYFSTCVVSVVFLTKNEFRVNPVRLAMDTLISVGFTIMSFALLYRVNGIVSVKDCNDGVDAVTTVYFSIVTFSTLGYGDYRPCQPSQLWAAGQAMLGNLHLGVMVGAAFLLAGGQFVSNQPENKV